MRRSRASRSACCASSSTAWRARNAALIHDALEVYTSLGAETVEVSLPHLPLSVPTYYVVAPAECSSNLSRFDGVRFGYRCAEPEGPARPVQALARRGIRRRGQAAHHDRHLRVVGRVFRCLLFEGAEGAPPDHRRFSRRLREGRPADRADHADAGLRHRRQDRRSRSPCT